MDKIIELIFADIAELGKSLESPHADAAEKQAAIEFYGGKMAERLEEAEIIPEGMREFIIGFLIGLTGVSGDK